MPRPRPTPPRGAPVARRESRRETPRQPHVDPIEVRTRYVCRTHYNPVGANGRGCPECGEARHASYAKRRRRRRHAGQESYPHAAGL
jgi:hypothetical protein